MSSDSSRETSPRPFRRASPGSDDDIQPLSSFASPSSSLSFQHSSTNAPLLRQPVGFSWNTPAASSANTYHAVIPQNPMAQFLPGQGSTVSGTQSEKPRKKSSKGKEKGRDKNKSSSRKHKDKAPAQPQYLQPSIPPRPMLSPVGSRASTAQTAFRVRAYVNDPGAAASPSPTPQGTGPYISNFRNVSSSSSASGGGPSSKSPALVPHHHVTVTPQGHSQEERRSYYRRDYEKEREHAPSRHAVAGSNGAASQPVPDLAAMYPYQSTPRGGHHASYQQQQEHHHEQLSTPSSSYKHKSEERRDRSHRRKHRAEAQRQHSLPLAAPRPTATPVPMQMTPASGYQPATRVLRTLTLLMEDRRYPEPESLLVEVRVPLKQADNPEDGFWADAKEVCDELQKGPSRIDGRAKVYTMRGKYRQIFLMITPEEGVQCSIANLRVSRERTLELFIDEISAPPGVSHQSQSSQYASPFYNRHLPTPVTDAVTSPSSVSGSLPMTPFASDKFSTSASGSGTGYEAQSESRSSRKSGKRRLSTSSRSSASGGAAGQHRYSSQQPSEYLRQSSPPPPRYGSPTSPTSPMSMAQMSPPAQPSPLARHSPMSYSPPARYSEPLSPQQHSPSPQQPPPSPTHPVRSSETRPQTQERPQHVRQFSQTSVPDELPLPISRFSETTASELPLSSRRSNKAPAPDLPPPIRRPSEAPASELSSRSPRLSELLTPEFPPLLPRFSDTSTSGKKPHSARYTETPVPELPPPILHFGTTIPTAPHMHMSQPAWSRQSESSAPELPQSALRTHFGDMSAVASQAQSPRTQFTETSVPEQAQATPRSHFDGTSVTASHMQMAQPVQTLAPAPLPFGSRSSFVEHRGLAEAKAPYLPSPSPPKKAKLDDAGTSYASPSERTAFPWSDSRSAPSASADAVSSNAAFTSTSFAGTFSKAARQSVSGLIRPSQGFGAFSSTSSSASSPFGSFSASASGPTAVTTSPEIDNTLIAHLKAAICKEPGWDKFVKGRSSVLRMSEQLEQYRYVKSKLDQYVDSLAPADLQGAANAKITKTHVIRAFNLKPIWVEECLEVLALTTMYGPCGKRYEDPRVVEMLDQPPAVTTGIQVAKYLALLRETHSRWTIEHPEA